MSLSNYPKPTGKDITAIMEVMTNEKTSLPPGAKSLPTAAKKYAAEFYRFLKSQGKVDKPVPDKSLSKQVIAHVEMLLQNEGVEEINEAPKSPELNKFLSRVFRGKIADVSWVPELGMQNEDVYIATFKKGREATASEIQSMMTTGLLIKKWSILADQNQVLLHISY